VRALANRLERPIAQSVGPPTAVEAVPSLHYEGPWFPIYAVSRAAGTSDFSGLACRLGERIGADGCAARVHIKVLDARSTPPNACSTPKTAGASRLFGLQTRTRNLIRSSTPSTPDRDAALMDGLVLSGVPNLPETGALQLQ
jgi:hypothetical protein